ncbi:hypothetical protein ACH4TV_07605 [Streptomyces sp. NPDC020898]|uniref:hypothetical protein n=1 Tax=Streptomyces sp. NPDC020898 TaxID=3365101 RepID=UPI0037B2EF5B
MYVRVKKWREDAQPEGSAAKAETVSGTQQLPGISPGGTGPVPRQRHAGAPARLGGAGGRGAHVRPRAGDTGSLSEGPWENTSEAGHTHDPHEVTVQLDGVGRQLEEFLVRQAKEGADASAGDGPVFVDETGRRSRRYRRIGIAVGMVCGVYAVVIVATLLSGNSNAPWLPVPGQQDEQPASQVDTSPLPAQSVQPSDSAGVGFTPTPGATVSAGVTPSQGASGVPAPVASVPVPSASTSPQRPSASAPQPNPATSPTAADPDPSPTVTTSPEPSPSTSVEPSPDPSDSPAADGGTGTVADGTNEPTPIAESPVEPSATGTTGDPAPSPTSATSSA